MTNTNALNNELNKLYDEPLDDAEIRQASSNLIEFFKVLVEIDNQQSKAD